MRSRFMNAAEQWVIAYWLLPAAPTQGFFRETIQRLATKYDAPLFEPHLTLAIGPDSTSQASRMLTRLTARPIELRIEGVTFSSKFTRTLFVRFAATSPLLQLRASLGGTDGSDFDPHLSLLYKKLPDEEQARLAAAIHCPFTAVAFDAVAATRCRIPVNTAADVAAWEIITSRRLGQ